MVNDTSVVEIDKALGEIDKLEDEMVGVRESLKKLDRLTGILSDVRRILHGSKDAINQLDFERRVLEEEKKKKDEEISQLTGEQRKILEEYDQIESQLKKFQSLVSKFEEKEFKFEDVKAMLSIFTILLEEIFQGQPHARILFTLHGGASSMTRDQLKNATGISGAMVLRAVHELDRADLVKYDSDTSEVTLVRRIY
ncbi:hypothetical protein GF325_14090 [Candidatus Bathyarchaeota archaeon]|nr:hypothetical protein [Candidatus Bathyarchaeota archaeon]